MIYVAFSFIATPLPASIHHDPPRLLRAWSVRSAKQRDSNHSFNWFIISHKKTLNFFTRVIYINRTCHESSASFTHIGASDSD